MQGRFNNIKEWMSVEAEYLRQAIQTEIPFMEKTSYSDLVTMYDKAVEKSLKTKIMDLYSEDCVVGEESEEVSGQRSADYIWYIDPIDGTTNFVFQKCNFTISVACFYRGQCVFGIVLEVIGNTMYHAIRGQGAFKDEERIFVKANHKDLHEIILCTPIIQDTFINEHVNKIYFDSIANEVCAVRSVGCISLELCMLAEGKIGMFLAMKSCPWDHNAAVLIVKEAGGIVSSIGPTPLHEAYSGPIGAFSNSIIRKCFFEGLQTGR